MASLREALLQRRDAYLTRCARLDSQGRDEAFDIRSAAARGFLEGGDDIPPECEARGVVRQRRRLWWLTDADRDAAADRLGNPEKLERSTAADWDRFLPWSDGGQGLYRTTMQLFDATRAFTRGEVREPNGVLDIGVLALPPLADTTDSVRKAWHLLLKCGCDESILRRSYELRIAKIGTLEGGPDADAWLKKTIQAFVGGFPGIDAIPNPFQDPPRGPPVFDESCPCQIKPPEKPAMGQAAPAPPPPPTLMEATIATADALLAAYGDERAQPVVDEFNAIGGADDTMIAALLLWLRDRWAAVPQDVRYTAASGAWRARHPELAPDQSPRPTADEVPIDQAFNRQWHADKDRFDRLRAVPQFFVALTALDVRGVCRAIFEAMWADADDAPYKKGKVDAADLDRDAYLNAIGRAITRDDAPFRLAALLQAPVGHLLVLDNADVEGGTGANRLTPPTYDGLSAYWWRTTICPSTIGHILAQVDTADFHIAEHLRFLGHFRPGGSRHRSGTVGTEGYEAWIARLVPAWVVDFMVAALLRVKFWVEDPPLDRPSGEEMTYWSENHQILFGSSEYLLPAWYPNERFAYLDKEASWHRDRAKVRVLAWLDHRLKLGFAEQNSGVYYNQHLPALFNLADFAPDDVVKTKALMVLDLMTFDIVRRTSRGAFVTASGRQYWGSKRNGWSVSLLSYIELLTGTVGDHLSVSENSAASFATSDYVDAVPEALLALAHDVAAPRVDRSRVSIDLSESKDYGIDLDSSSGLVFWWGCGAYFTDETYSASQSWSYRWGLRHSGPFNLFRFIDAAGIRLLSSVISLVVGAVETTVVGLVANALTKLLGEIPFVQKAVPEGNFPTALVNAAILTPRLLRRYIDLYLSLADALVGVVAAAMKEVGLLDENDDRVRVARPALEQEFRELAIAFNAGSVLQRQHYYGWRSRDAILSSLTDNVKGATAFQSEPCVATLGLNVSVFTGKRPKTDDDGGSKFGAAVKNYASGLARYAYNPATFGAQFEIGGGESAPELGGAAAPFLASEVFGDDGPMYWFGNMSAPMVAQQENVAVSIYAPDDLQASLCPEQTHAHWPFDHFDEFRTEPRNGGRWLFGRRDRRFPPRTPCMPRPERQPQENGAWPVGRWRDEGGEGSGYIALFSARDLKTVPSSPYANREVVAEGGHDNIWITVVGDRATYGSFDEFVSDVLAAIVTTDIAERTAAITLPLPGTASTGAPGKRFEVSWDDGIRFDGQRLGTDDWPRFEWRRSAVPVAQALQPSPYELRVDDVRLRGQRDPTAAHVAWAESGWRVDVDVRAWLQFQQDHETGRSPTWTEVPGLLYLKHDIGDLEHPRRETSAEGLQVLQDRPNPLAHQTVTAAAMPAAIATPTSMLGGDFRREKNTFIKLRTKP
jgi:hypothetical protein